MFHVNVVAGYAPSGSVIVVPMAYAYLLSIFLHLLATTRALIKRFKN